MYIAFGVAIGHAILTWMESPVQPIGTPRKRTLRSHSVQFRLVTESVRDLQRQFRLVTESVRNLQRQFRLITESVRDHRGSSY